MEKSAAFYAGIYAAFEKEAAMPLPKGTAITAPANRLTAFMQKMKFRRGAPKTTGVGPKTTYRPPYMQGGSGSGGGMPFQQGLQATPSGSPVRGAAQNIYGR